MQIKHLVVGGLNTNCYLLISGDALAIIDPGGDADLILDEVKKTKAKPKFIINTHYHFDHNLANQQIRQATGAKILIHENEKDYIDFKVDRFLQDGDEVKLANSALKVAHTPGHTKGSICLLSNGSIFTGDTLFKDGCGRTDLSGGSEAEMAESLKKLKNILKHGLMVYPGHGEIYCGHALLKIC